MMVDRRSVAKVLAKIRAHRFEHFRKHRRGGVIVEVSAAHRSYYSTGFLSSSNSCGTNPDDRGHKRGEEKVYCVPGTPLRTRSFEGKLRGNFGFASGQAFAERFGLIGLREVVRGFVFGESRVH